MKKIFEEMERIFASNAALLKMIGKIEIKKADSKNLVQLADRLLLQSEILRVSSEILLRQVNEKAKKDKSTDHVPGLMAEKK